MKKFLLLLGLLFAPYVSSAAVLYDHSIVDGTTYNLTGWDISPNVGYYNMPASIDGVSNFYSGPFFYTLTGKEAILRVKPVDLSTCGRQYFQSPVAFGGTTASSNPGRVDVVGWSGYWGAPSRVVGDYCEFDMSDTTADVHESVVGMRLSNFALWTNTHIATSFYGSPLNSGYTFGNGTVAPGGVAFQLCDAGGCSGGFNNPASSTPTLSSPNQFKADGVTAIAESATTTESTLVFGGTVVSTANNQAKLQVEFKDVSQVFDGTNLLEGNFVASGSIATTTKNSLTEGSYHWRARAVDDKGNTSEWQEFGTVGNTDVVVAKSISKNINVAMILAESSDVAHTATSITAQPCKLVPEKTYVNGYGKEYYTDLAYCINDYYKEVSHNTVNFTFQIFDNGGRWYKTDKTEAYYGSKNPIDLKSTGREDEFITDATSLSLQDLKMNAFDTVAVVHAGVSYQTNLTSPKINLATQTWTPFGTLFGNKPYKFIIAEHDPVGFWAHEMGHIVGVLFAPQNTMTPDLYNMGNVAKWDLMASANNNGGPLDFLNFAGNGTNPAYMSSYTQEFLGWLKEDIHPKSASGTTWINSLETSNIGDSIFRYNLENNTSSSTEQYYILEARNRSLGTWDSSLPEDKALVLYRVDASGSPQEYGYESESIRNQKRRISIPVGTLHTGASDGVLSVSGETYQDLDNMVKISTEGDRTVNGKYEIAASIQGIPATSFLGRMNGVVFRPVRSFYQNYFGNIQGAPVLGFKGSMVFTTDLLTYFIKDTLPYPLFFLVLSLILLSLYKKKNLKNSTEHKVAKFFVWLLWIVSVLVWVVYLVFITLVFTGTLRYTPQGFDPACGEIKTRENPDPCHGRNYYAPLPNSISPDLDLHAITPDGKHVGMNYATGEYENQIPGSIVSGDNQGIPEWIYVPEGTHVKYYVSAHDNDEFLKQNPHIASAVATTTDTYSLYARTIDPATGIFTSPILENQTIAPTEEKAYQITIAGADVSVKEKVDLVPPVTNPVISGVLGLNGWYTSATTIALDAADNEGGVGVEKTTYSLDGAEWQVYATSTPVAVSSDGTHTLQYHSVDYFGNTEATSTLVVKIDKTLPEVLISFSTSTQKLLIQGIDEGGVTTVVTTATSTIVTDLVGNTLNLVFSKSKQEKGELKTEVKEMYYNGTLVTNLPKTTLQYEWSADKKGNMKELEQKIFIGSLKTEAHYDAKKNVTEVKKETEIGRGGYRGEEMKEKREFKVTLPGLVVIGLTTNQGKIEVNY